jgi:hypothetical protein
MEILFEPENAILKIKWQPNNSSLGVADYIEEWVSIQRYVEILKPHLLLINMKMFGYRKLPEIIPIFNSITEKLTPHNIAIVKCNDILGNKTVENLLNRCPQKGHQIFEDNNLGESWLKIRTSIVDRL